MEKIIYDIHKMMQESLDCYNNKNYLASLMIALMLPDLCSKIETNCQNKTGERYVKWCNKWMNGYLGSILPSFTDSHKEKFGQIIYSLRCGLFHSGEKDISKFNPDFFKLSELDFCVNEDLDIINNFIFIEGQQISGFVGNKNEYRIKINIGYLICSILQSVSLFIDSMSLNDSVFPQIEIEIIKK